MVVHAAPNTHPSGVQGALLADWYQTELAPSPAKIPPMNKPPKFTIRKMIINNENDFFMTEIGKV